jgi:thiol-disulfide isomerase/thioredoxin
MFGLWLALSFSLQPACGQSEPVPEELASVRSVQTHLQQNDLAAAEKEFARQLQLHPEFSRVHALHMNFAFAYRRANRHAEAFRHMQKLVDFYASASAREPQLYKQLANAIVSMSKYSRESEKVDSATAKISDVLALLATRQNETPTDETLGAIHDVRLRLLEFLISIGDYSSAEEQLDLELKMAKQEYEEKSGNPAFILRLSNALRSRVELRDAVGAESLEDARTRQLTFLQSKAEEHPGHEEIISAYVDAHLAAVGALAHSHPDQAAKVLVRTQKFVSNLDRSSRPIDQIVMIAETSFRYLQKSIDEGRRHARLVGKPSPPPEFAAWSNGKPLLPDDMKGKVVLLDFWAVWCVSCLESFPHLTEWNERYAGEGLEVIGVTRFYNYRWDDEKKVPYKETERPLPQREELAMLQKFAMQQKIGYRFAVTSPGSTYDAKFHVEGLPQTVLIDRQGKIRLIRVGTGPTVFREIKETIETLLAEKATDAEKVTEKAASP